MKTAESGIIYQNAVFHCGMPSLAKLSEREYICAFRRAPDRRQLGRPATHHCDTNADLLLTRSVDGKAWQEPELFYHHPLGGSQDPCLFRTAAGTLLCSSYGYVLTESHYESRSNQLHHGPYHFLGGYMLRSEDRGDTWETDVSLPRLEINRALDYQGKPYRPFNRGSFAQDPETGRIFWPATRHASFHPARGAIDLFVSDDDGKSWKREAVIADDDETGFNEVSLVLTPAGELIAFMRSFGADDHLFVARAGNLNAPDFQVTKSQCTGHPYHALLRSDDSLLLTYGYRGEVNQIRARLLQPPTYDVDSAREYVLRDGGGSWDIGYPWAAETANGDALVCYYWNEADKAPHIAWSRVSF